MSEKAAIELGQAPALQSEVPNTAEQHAEPAPAPDDKPKVDPVQRRFDKLTKARYMAEAEAASAKLEAEALRQQLQQHQQRPSANTDGEPKLDQFDNFDAYIAAKAAYIADQRLTEKLTEREQRDQERRQQEQGAKTTEAWNKRLADVRKEVPDYDDVIESADVVITHAMGQAIMDSDLGPKIALYLARNPEEAERLASLPATSVARAIGRIEAKIEGEALVQKQSAAPKPATPVSGKGTGGKSLFDASYDDFVKQRQKQIAARR